MKLNELGAALAEAWKTEPGVRTLAAFMQYFKWDADFLGAYMASGVRHPKLEQVIAENCTRGYRDRDELSEAMLGDGMIGIPNELCKAIGRYGRRIQGRYPHAELRTLQDTMGLKPGHYEAPWRDRGRRKRRR